MFAHAWLGGLTRCSSFNFLLYGWAELLTGLNFTQGQVNFSGGDEVNLRVRNSWDGLCDVSAEVNLFRKFFSWFFSLKLMHAFICQLASNYREELLIIENIQKPHLISLVNLSAKLDTMEASKSYHVEKREEEVWRNFLRQAQQNGPVWCQFCSLIILPNNAILYPSKSPF